MDVGRIRALRSGILGSAIVVENRFSYVVANLFVRAISPELPNGVFSHMSQVTPWKSALVRGQADAARNYLEQSEQDTVKRFGSGSSDLAIEGEVSGESDGDSNDDVDEDAGNVGTM